MKKKIKIEKKDMIEYLSVDSDMRSVTYREDKQSKYIREYVRSKAEYAIVATFRRCGLNQRNINLQWNLFCKLIREGKVDGVVVANMAAISSSLSDAYHKVGQIIEAGGIVVTVDEGKLFMNIQMTEVQAHEG